MANSDWLNDKKPVSEDQPAEQQWVYFTPVLGHRIEDNWQASVTGRVWLDPCADIVPHIHEHDLFLFWRAPLKAT